jgi:predicted transcriptional regulator
MKAIIEVSRRNSIFDAALADMAGGGSEDFHLSFESARLLFSELTPARPDLLDTLRKSGSFTVKALSKAAARNYSNVHIDVARLVELGLIERTEDDRVFVPFDAVEVHFRLAAAA